MHRVVLYLSISVALLTGLSETLPTTAVDTVSEFTRAKRYRQLQAKDFPKVPTWRLERDSNPRPTGGKALILPMCHHAPQDIHK